VQDDRPIDVRVNIDGHEVARLLAPHNERMRRRGAR
jgi:hypothetical protein